MLLKVLLVMLFGAVGCGLRFLSLEMAAHFGGGTPEKIFWSTLGVNVVGCFLIGLLYGHWPAHSLDETTRWWRDCISIGLLGGYTTFSAFSAQTIDLLERGHFVLAAANMVLSLVLCLAATWSGLSLMRLT